MKFFTFLGLGHPEKGYMEIVYDLKGEKIKSTFVQIPIISVHKEIDEMIVFVTKKSYDSNAEYLNLLIEESNIRIKVTYEFIETWTDYQELCGKMFSHLNENEEFIFDVTHSYRIIPMKLITTLDYIKSVKNVKLKHIYYGIMYADGKKGEILDFIQDVTNSKIANALDFFNKTLKVDTTYFQGNTQIDKDILNLLYMCERLNEIIEGANFDGSLSIINQILSKIREILKKDNCQYFKEFLYAIENKFRMFDISKKVESKIALIYILLESKYYQLAITFTDQLFREVLVQRSLPVQYNQIVKEDQLYTVSQKLLNKPYYMLRNYTDDKYIKFLDGFSANKEIFLIVNQNKNAINDYYNEIRNRINHASMPNLALIDKSIKNMCKVIQCIDKVK